MEECTCPYANIFCPYDKEDLGLPCELGECPELLTWLDYAKDLHLA